MLGGVVFGIGMSEMLIILAVALLVFGPNKLPEIAKSLAKGLRELRRAGDDLKASVNLDLDDDRPRRAPRAAPAVAATAGIPDSRPDALSEPLQADPGAEGSPHEDAAHIPGSELTGAGGSSAPAAEIWPRPAEGTLAQGSLDDGAAEGQERAPGDTKVG